MHLEKDKLYICFHKPKSIIGFLISLRTLGKYSHCEFIYNDYVYLSNPGGVRIKPFVYKDNMDIFELDSHIEIPVVLEEFKKLKGKGYDYGAIFFSQLLELGIEHKDKYFCFSPLRYWGGLYHSMITVYRICMVLVPFDIGVVYI